MRALPPHTAPTRAVCVSDLRIQFLVAVCVGMVHMIFSGTHTAPKTQVFFFNLYPVMFSLYLPCCVHKSFRTHVIIPPAYEVYMVYSFRRFNHHICMRLCSSPEPRAHM